MIDCLSEKCGACRKALTEAGVLAGDDVYHPVCLKCNNCGGFLGETFYLEAGKPVCSHCHRGNAETCCVCENKIMDDSIECKGKFFHPDCMKVVFMKLA